MGTNQDNNDAERTVRFERLADPPHLYFARDFLSEDECDSMCRLATAMGYGPTGWGMESTLDIDRCQGLIAEGKVTQADLHFLQNLADRRTALSGAPDCCRVPTVRITQPPASDSHLDLGQVWFPMHLDTLEADAYMTIIIYLTTVPPQHGGHLLFPLAAAKNSAPPEKLLQASQSMIQKGMYGLKHGWADNCLNEEAVHLATKAAAMATAQVVEVPLLPDEEEAAKNGKDGAPRIFQGHGGQGLAIAAQRGNAICFFTRCTDGSIDPTAYHAVAAMSQARKEERCIAQLFHSLPITTVRDRYGRLKPQPAAQSRGSAASFCRDHATLKPCTAGGIRFEIDGFEG